MAALPIRHITNAGAAPATQAPTASDSADYGTGHNSYLHYTNSSVTSVTVTISPVKVLTSGATYPPKVYTLAATTGELLIPLFQEYDDGTGANTVTVTTSAQPSGALVALVRCDF